MPTPPDHPDDPSSPPERGEPRPSTQGTAAIPEAQPTAGELASRANCGPVICPALREVLCPEATEEILATLSAGDVVCTVCEAPIAPRLERRASVLALRAPDGRTQIRFAHERCAESRLIELDHDPIAPAPAAATRGGGHGAQPAAAWALSARRGRVPTIVLACELSLFNRLEVQGDTLLSALRLHDLRGGRSVDDVAPARCEAMTMASHGSTLWLATPYGTEALQVGCAEPVPSLLQVAAHQRELLLVLGVALELSSGSLEVTDRQLRDGRAVAARVRFDNVELSRHPLPSSRRSLARLLAPGPGRGSRRGRARRLLPAPH